MADRNSGSSPALGMGGSRSQKIDTNFNVDPSMIATELSGLTGDVILLKRDQTTGQVKLWSNIPEQDVTSILSYVPGVQQGQHQPA